MKDMSTSKYEFGSVSVHVTYEKDFFFSFFFSNIFPACTKARLKSPISED